MSASLHWRPVPIPPDDDHAGGMGLRRALAKILWPETDGSLATTWTRIGHDLIPFLEAIEQVADPETAADANALVGTIKQYGEIEIQVRR